MKQTLGIVEIQGLVYTIACADAALKAANVQLLGCESSKGGARFVLKLSGNVGSVRAAIDAAVALATKHAKSVVGYVIPRPADGCWEMVNPVLSEKKDRTENMEGTENLGLPTGFEGTKPVELLEEPVGLEESKQQQKESLENEAIKSMASETLSQEAKDVVTCNLCKDPRCKRHKGEPHERCIHFKGSE